MASGVIERDSQLGTVSRRLAFPRRFAPSLSERRFALSVADQAALLVAFVAALGSAVIGGGEAAVAAALLLSASWWLTSGAFDCYEVRRLSDLPKSLASAWGALAITSVVAAGAARLLPASVEPAQIVLFALVGGALLGGLRLLFFLALKRPESRRGLLVLGADEGDVDEAVRVLESEGKYQYEILGTASSKLKDLTHSANVGAYWDLAELVRRHGPNEIVVTAPEDDAVATDAITTLRRAYPGIAVRHFADVYEELTRRVAVQYLCAHWPVRVEAQVGTQAYVVLKRALDVAVASVGLVLLSPALAAIALAIRLDSPGPVIYRQPRQGLHGRMFTMLKFRTMTDRAEENEAVWARPDDPRRTRLGKILRPVHLDELPQLLNVLRGDMSLVGPRPERSEFITQLERVVPSYHARMLVRPGITGWAQVRFCYARSLEESVEKLEHDLYYVKHRSPFLDLVILLKTMSAVVRPSDHDRVRASFRPALVIPRIDAGMSAPANNDVRSVLVVGGAGYIGSVLCRRLLSEGYRVRVLDALLYGNDSVRELIGNPRFELRHGDSRDPAALVGSLRDVQAVVHLGEIVGDPACALDEAATLQINVSGTRLVAEVSKGFGVHRFLYASSCSVYGASDEVLTERSSLNPVSLYARAKIASERSLAELETDLFRPIIFRLATVYGLSPRPRFDLVVNLLAAQAVTDKHITVYGGDQWRPFVHVSDVARAMSEALRAPIANVGGQIFNLGSEPQNYTIQEIAEMVRELVPETFVEHSPSDADRRNYRVSFAKVRATLGFEPAITVGGGIAEIAAAMRAGMLGDYRNPRYSNVTSLRLINGQTPIRTQRPSDLEFVSQTAAQAVAT
jgi:exopolysaccharide biosynthesis polyprenyl glycosylphosphotransferase